MIDPKDKAIEIYLKHKQLTTYVDVVYNKDTLDKFHNNAISAALITVREIIKELEECFIYSMYWKQVKEELEKL